MGISTKVDARSLAQEREREREKACLVTGKYVV